MQYQLPPLPMQKRLLFHISDEFVYGYPTGQDPFPEILLTENSLDQDAVISLLPIGFRTEQEFFYQPAFCIVEG